MTGPGFAAVKRALICRLLLILPVCGQKVKSVSPSPLEVGVRSREKEPARSAHRATIASSFRHDVDTSL